MAPLVIDPPWHARLASLVAFAAFAFFAFRVPVPDQAWLAWPIRVFCAVVALVNLAGAYRRVVIDEHRLRWRRLPPRSVNWPDVADLVGKPSAIVAVRTRSGVVYDFPGRVTYAEVEPHLPRRLRPPTREHPGRRALRAGRAFPGALGRAIARERRRSRSTDDG